MLQWLSVFPEFPEFSESYVPFRKKLHRVTLWHQVEWKGGGTLRGSEDTQTLPAVIEKKLRCKKHLNHAPLQPLVPNHPVNFSLTIFRKVFHFHTLFTLPHTQRARTSEKYFFLESKSPHTAPDPHLRNFSWKLWRILKSHRKLWTRARRLGKYCQTKIQLPTNKSLWWVRTW